MVLLALGFGGPVVRGRVSQNLHFSGGDHLLTVFTDLLERFHSDCLVGSLAYFLCSNSKIEILMNDLNVLPMPIQNAL